MAETFEYAIAGGGLVGCVVASRLAEAGRTVALIEAGPEDYSEKIMSPVAAPHLHSTAFEYNMTTTKQPGLGNRVVPNFVGKLLSGSSAVNYGLWTRGHSADYDAWAKVSGDDRWSYKNMLEYFKKVETHYNPQGSREMYGFAGPIFTTAGGRRYPLRDSVSKAMVDAGLEYNPDTNGGNPFGFGAFTENWKNAQRQPASKVYNLSQVKIFTNSVVARVDFNELRAATGVTLITGEKILASKEVIVSCGALKTPQVLMLSGIGPEEELSRHGIKMVANLPVGQNLHDHISATIFWKLKRPEAGLSLGSPAFNKPEFFAGNPMEWIATIPTPREELEKAAAIDGIDPNDVHLEGKRGNVEVMVAYAPIAGGGSDFRLPFDGKHISTPVVLLLPTARGTVTLANTDPANDPVLDPHYLETETDKAAVRAGMRLALRIMETAAAKDIVEGETGPVGFAPLTSESSDAELDARMQIVGSSFFQNAGTASMGTVVDSQCRVLGGIQKLRVLDASVLPVPLAAHYQAPMYAFGEAAADMLLDS